MPRLTPMPCLTYASLTFTSLTCTALAVPLPAIAREPVTLASTVFVETLDNDLDGQQRRMLATPGRLGPGDRLVFVLRYHNDGATPVSGFSVTNPVPRTVRVDPGHPGMQVSVDGGRNWGSLTTLQVRTPLGGVRRATAEDITHVRWTVTAPVSPGAGGQIAYRGTVR